MWSYSYMILAPAAMAAEADPKKAAARCFEEIGLDPDSYRIGHTKASYIPPKELHFEIFHVFCPSSVIPRRMNILIFSDKERNLSNTLSQAIGIPPWNLFGASIILYVFSFYLTSYWNICTLMFFRISPVFSYTWIIECSLSAFRSAFYLPLNSYVETLVPRFIFLFVVLPLPPNIKYCMHVHLGIPKSRSLVSTPSEVALINRNPWIGNRRIDV